MVNDIGRNEPCPCGSGKKYKNCCEGRKVDRKPLLRAVPGVLLLIGLAVSAYYFTGIGGSEEPVAPSPRESRPAATRVPDPSQVARGEKVTVMENERFRVTARRPDSAALRDTAAQIFSDSQTVNLPPKQSLK